MSPPRSVPDSTSDPRHPGRITAGELVLVCSHYNLGTIRTVRKLPGGSRESPKVLLISDHASYLLKRRAPGAASDPHTVALTHEIILFLESRGVPAPQLVCTRKDNNSLLQLSPEALAKAPGPAADEPATEPVRGPRVYEVYKFVRGRPYARTTGDASGAGDLLAHVHAELREFRPSWRLPRGSYHARPDAARLLRSIARHQPEHAPICRSLEERYARAWERAAANGADLLSEQIIHADWHPGNLIYAIESAQQPLSKVAAILDFDSARQAPALMDAVNGAMQFALGKKTVAGQMQLALGPDLFQAFWAGFNRARRERPPQIDDGLDQARPSIPWLMIEALVLEAATPIAATGAFERMEAGAILRAVDKAAGALENAQTELVRLSSIQ